MTILKFQHESGLVVEYDPTAKAVYVRIRQGQVAKTLEKEKNFFLDLDDKGRLLGIEILDPQKKPLLKRKKALESAAKQFGPAELRYFHPEVVPLLFA